MNGFHDWLWGSNTAEYIYFFGDLASAADKDHETRGLRELVWNAMIAGKVALVQKPGDPCRTGYPRPFQYIAQRRPA